MKNLIKISVLFALAFATTACSKPHYAREITSVYDANGKLVSTTVVDRVEQVDTNGRPLRRYFGTATYENVPSEHEIPKK